MTKLKVVVLVSPDHSDIYFANQLMKRVNVVGVFVEQQHAPVKQTQRLGRALKLLGTPWQLLRKLADNRTVAHFNKLSGEIDLATFGQECLRLFPKPGCTITYTEGCRKINAPQYVEKIRQLQPDLIALCGTSIIKKQIIALPPKGILNLHGGLPQKYRGVWTTLWAMHNNEPEYIGPTVHYVDDGIDTGGIIFQARPEISANDNPETLYVKVVKLGIEMMIQAICDIENGKASSHQLQEVGDLYLGRMVTAAVLRRAWGPAAAAALHAYLASKGERDKKVEQVMVGRFPPTTAKGAA